MNYGTRLRELGCKPPAERESQSIDAIEAGIGVPLPADYRGFLAACGGWWGDTICRCLEPTPFGPNHVNSKFHSANEVRSLLDSVIAPRNVLTIGAGSFAKYICLSIAGIDHGWVYALDGESRSVLE